MAITLNELCKNVIRCNPEFRDGGISRLIIIDCTVCFNDITDISEWCKYASEGKICITGEIIGGKDGGSAIDKEIYDCQPAKTIGYTYAITIQDYNADLMNCKEVKFWNEILTYPEKYQLAFITCSGHLYGVIKNFAANGSVTIEDDVSGNTFWNINISWLDYKEICPIYIPDFINRIQENCVYIPPIINIECCPLTVNLQSGKDISFIDNIFHIPLVIKRQDTNNPNATCDKYKDLQLSLRYNGVNPPILIPLDGKGLLPTISSKDIYTINIDAEASINLLNQYDIDIFNTPNLTLEVVLNYKCASGDLLLEAEGPIIIFDPNAKEECCAIVNTYKSGPTASNTIDGTEYAITMSIYRELPQEGYTCKPLTSNCSIRVYAKDVETSPNGPWSNTYKTLNISNVSEVSPVINVNNIPDANSSPSSHTLFIKRSDILSLINKTEPYTHEIPLKLHFQYECAGYGVRVADDITVVLPPKGDTECCPINISITNCASNQIVYDKTSNTYKVQLLATSVPSDSNKDCDVYTRADVYFEYKATSASAWSAPRKISGTNAGEWNMITLPSDKITDATFEHVIPGADITEDTEIKYYVKYNCGSAGGTGVASTCKLTKPSCCDIAFGCDNDTKGDTTDGCWSYRELDGKVIFNGYYELADDSANCLLLSGLIPVKYRVRRAGGLWSQEFPISGLFLAGPYTPGAKNPLTFGLDYNTDIIGKLSGISTANIEIEIIADATTLNCGTGRTIFVIPKPKTCCPILVQDNGTPAYSTLSNTLPEITQPIILLNDISGQKHEVSLHVPPYPYEIRSTFNFTVRTNASTNIDCGNYDNFELSLRYITYYKYKGDPNYNTDISPIKILSPSEYNLPLPQTPIINPVIAGSVDHLVIEDVYVPSFIRVTGTDLTNSNLGLNPKDLKTYLSTLFDEYYVILEYTLTYECNDITQTPIKFYVTNQLSDAIVNCCPITLTYTGSVPNVYNTILDAWEIPYLLTSACQGVNYKNQVTFIAYASINGGPETQVTLQSIYGPNLSGELGPISKTGTLYVEAKGILEPANVKNNTNANINFRIVGTAECMNGSTVTSELKPTGTGGSAPECCPPKIDASYTGYYPVYTNNIITDYKWKVDIEVNKPIIAGKNCKPYTKITGSYYILYFDSITSKNQNSPVYPIFNVDNPTFPFSTNFDITNSLLINELDIDLINVGGSIEVIMNVIAECGSDTQQGKSTVPISNQPTYVCCPYTPELTNYEFKPIINNNNYLINSNGVVDELITFDFNIKRDVIIGKKCANYDDFDLSSIVYTDFIGNTATISTIDIQDSFTTANDIVYVKDYFNISQFNINGSDTISVQFKLSSFAKANSNPNLTLEFPAKSIQFNFVAKCKGEEIIKTVLYEGEHLCCPVTTQLTVSDIVNSSIGRKDKVSLTISTPAGAPGQGYAVMPFNPCSPIGFKDKVGTDDIINNGYWVYIKVGNNTEVAIRATKANFPNMVATAFGVPIETRFLSLNEYIELTLEVPEVDILNYITGNLPAFNNGNPIPQNTPIEVRYEFAPIGWDVNNNIVITKLQYPLGYDGMSPSPNCKPEVTATSKTKIPYYVAECCPIRINTITSAPNPTNSTTYNGVTIKANPQKGNKQDAEISLELNFDFPSWNLPNCQDITSLVLEVRCSKGHNQYVTDIINNNSNYSNTYVSGTTRVNQLNQGQTINVIFKEWWSDLAPKLGIDPLTIPIGSELAFNFKVNNSCQANTDKKFTIGRNCCTPTVTALTKPADTTECIYFGFSLGFNFNNPNCYPYIFEKSSFLLSELKDFIEVAIPSLGIRKKLSQFPTSILNASAQQTQPNSAVVYTANTAHKFEGCLKVDDLRSSLSDKNYVWGSNINIEFHYVPPARNYCGNIDVLGQTTQNKKIQETDNYCCSLKSEPIISYEFRWDDNINDYNLYYKCKVKITREGTNCFEFESIENKVQFHANKWIDLSSTPVDNADYHSDTIITTVLDSTQLAAINLGQPVEYELFSGVNNEYTWDNIISLYFSNEPELIGPPKLKFCQIGATTQLKHKCKTQTITDLYDSGAQRVHLQYADIKCPVYESKTTADNNIIVSQPFQLLGNPPSFNPWKIKEIYIEARFHTLGINVPGDQVSNYFKISLSQACGLVSAYKLVDTIDEAMITTNYITANDMPIKFKGQYSMNCIKNWLLNSSNNTGYVNTYAIEAFLKVELENWADCIDGQNICTLQRIYRPGDTIVVNPPAKTCCGITAILQAPGDKETLYGIYPNVAPHNAAVKYLDNTFTANNPIQPRYKGKLIISRDATDLSTCLNLEYAKYRYTFNIQRISGTSTVLETGPGNATLNPYIDLASDLVQLNTNISFSKEVSYDFYHTDIMELFDFPGTTRYTSIEIGLELVWKCVGETEKSTKITNNHTGLNCCDIVDYNERLFDFLPLRNLTKQGTLNSSIFVNTNSCAPFFYNGFVAKLKFVDKNNVLQQNISYQPNDVSKFNITFDKPMLNTLLGTQWGYNYNSNVNYTLNIDTNAIDAYLKATYPDTYTGKDVKVDVYLLYNCWNDKDIEQLIEQSMPISVPYVSCCAPEITNFVGAAGNRQTSFNNNRVDTKFAYTVTFSRPSNFTNCSPYTKLELLYTFTGSNEWFAIDISTLSFIPAGDLLALINGGTAVTFTINKWYFQDIVSELNMPAPYNTLIANNSSFKVKLRATCSGGGSTTSSESSSLTNLNCCLPTTEYTIQKDIVNNCYNYTAKISFQFNNTLPCINWSMDNAPISNSDLKSLIRMKVDVINTSNDYYYTLNDIDGVTITESNRPSSFSPIPNTGTFWTLSGCIPIDKLATKISSEPSYVASTPVNLFLGFDETKFKNYHQVCNTNGISGGPGDEFKDTPTLPNDVPSAGGACCNLGIKTDSSRDPVNLYAIQKFIPANGSIPTFAAANGLFLKAPNPPTYDSSFITKDPNEPLFVLPINLIKDCVAHTFSGFKVIVKANIYKLVGNQYVLISGQTSFNTPVYSFENGTSVGWQNVLDKINDININPNVNIPVNVHLSHSQLMIYKGLPLNTRYDKVEWEISIEATCISDNNALHVIVGMGSITATNILYCCTPVTDPSVVNPVAIVVTPGMINTPNTIGGIELKLNNNTNYPSVDQCLGYRFLGHDTYSNNDYIYAFKAKLKYEDMNGGNRNILFDALELGIDDTSSLPHALLEASQIISYNIDWSDIYNYLYSDVLLTGYDGRPVILELFANVQCWNGETKELLLFHNIGINMP